MSRLSFLRSPVILILLSLVVAVRVVMGGAAPPAGYNNLQTIYVFKDQDPGGWAGSSGGLEVTQSNTLPMDTAVTYNGLPSLRVNVKRRSSWWLAIIPIAGCRPRTCPNITPTAILSSTSRATPAGKSSTSVSRIEFSSVTSTGSWWRKSNRGSSSPTTLRSLRIGSTFRSRCVT